MPKTVRINVPQQMYSDTEEVVDDGSHALHTYVPGNELEHVTTVDNALFCADISDDECRRNSVRSRETPAVDVCTHAGTSCIYFSRHLTAARYLEQHSSRTDNAFDPLVYAGAEVWPIPRRVPH